MFLLIDKNVDRVTCIRHVELLVTPRDHQSELQITDSELRKEKKNFIASISECSPDFLIIWRIPNLFSHTPVTQAQIRGKFVKIHYKG